MHLSIRCKARADREVCACTSASGARQELIEECVHAPQHQVHGKS